MPSLALCDAGGGTGGRRTGKCKWFNVVRGYGFIEPDDGSQDVFVHQVGLQDSSFAWGWTGHALQYGANKGAKSVAWEC